MEGSTDVTAEHKRRQHVHVRQRRRLIRAGVHAVAEQKVEYEVQRVSHISAQCRKAKVIYERMNEWTNERTNEWIYGSFLVLGE